MKSSAFKPKEYRKSRAVTSSSSPERTLIAGTDEH